MTVRIRTITFDCTDPYLLVGFWSQLTGEGKAVKNRVHLDLAPPPAPPGTPTEVTADARDAEVQRALGLGATIFADHRREDRTGFVVLAAPEGNEFCIERGISGG